MKRQPDWLVRIGGSAAISVPGFLITYGFALATQLLGSSALWNSSLWARFVTITGAQLLMYGWLLLARLIARRLPVAQLPLANVITYAVAGFIFSISIGLLTVALGLADTADLNYRIPVGTPLMTLVLVLAAVQVQATRDHRANLHALMEANTRLQRTRAKVEYDIDAWRETVPREIRERVESEMGQVIDADPVLAVHQLRSLSHEIVRPLSHDLAGATGPFAPVIAAPLKLGMQWHRIVTDAVGSVSIRPVEFSIIMTILASALLVTLLGIFAALAPIAVTFGVLLISCVLLARVLARVWPRCGTALRVILTMLAYTGAGLLANAGVLLTTQAPELGSVLLLATPFFSVVGGILALESAVGVQRRQVEINLRTLNVDLNWFLARANETFYSQRRALSRTLHGPVQAAINAAALRIDVASQAGSCDAEFVTSALLPIHRALDLISDENTGHADPDIALENIAAAWEGLCHLDVKLPDEVKTRLRGDPICAASVVDILTEACSDAMRHSSADAIHITVELLRPNQLVIVVKDNGAPRTLSGASGLGSALLDETTLQWERAADQSGTTLLAVLPSEEPHASLPC